MDVVTNRGNWFQNEMQNSDKSSTYNDTCAQERFSIRFNCLPLLMAGVRCHMLRKD